MGKTANSNRTCHLVDFGRSRIIRNTTRRADADRIVNTTANSHQIYEKKMYSDEWMKVLAYEEANSTLKEDGLFGSIEFTSSNNLLGNSGYERDDLESVVYTASYLLSGRHTTKLYYDLIICVYLNLCVK